MEANKVDTEIKPMDIEVRPIENEDWASQLINNTGQVVIESPTDMETGAELDGHLASAIKKLEAERTGWVKPLNDQVKRINERFKPLKTALEGARATIQNKMLTYRREQQRKADEEAARIRNLEEEALEAARKLEAEGETEKAEEVLAEAVEAPREVVPVQTGPTKSESGSTSSFITEWGFELLDISKVPTEYLMVDEKKVLNRIKREELRDVPGLRIFSTERMRTRIG